MEESSDQEVLSAKKQVVDQMKQFTSKYQKMNIKPTQPATIKYIPSSITFPQFGCVQNGLLTYKIDNLSKYTTVGGFTQFTIITMDSNGDCIPIGGSEVSVQFESSNGEVTKGQVRDNHNGSYVVIFVAKKVGKMQLSVSVNKQKVVEEPYSVITQRYSMHNSCKIVNGDGSMGKPWGIVFGKNGMWAVIDNAKHCVYVFDRDNKLMKTSWSGTQNNQFVYP